MKSPVRQMARQAFTMLRNMRILREETPYGESVDHMLGTAILILIQQRQYRTSLPDIPVQALAHGRRFASWELRFQTFNASIVCAMVVFDMIGRRMLIVLSKIATMTDGTTGAISRTRITRRTGKRVTYAELPALV